MMNGVHKTKEPMIYLMSTTVIPSGSFGCWEIQSISSDEVAGVLQEKDFVSAIGHESTAKFMSEILGQPVEFNRLSVVPIPGDTFYCFKLDRRPPEGAILDRAELENLGASWAVMNYYG